MDIFGRELDVQIIANYSEYIGVVKIEENGDFEANLDTPDANLFGTYGHFLGHISEDNDQHNYTIDYLFDQHTIFPGMPPFASFSNTAIATEKEGSIVFDNIHNDGVYISFFKPQEIIVVTTDEKPIGGEDLISTEEELKPVDEEKPVDQKEEVGEEELETLDEEEPVDQKEEVSEEELETLDEEESVDQKEEVGEEEVTESEEEIA